MTRRIPGTMFLPDDIGPIDWAEEDTGRKPVVRNARRMALPGARRLDTRVQPSFTRQRSPVRYLHQDRLHPHKADLRCNIGRKGPAYISTRMED